MKPKSRKILETVVDSEAKKKAHAGRPTKVKVKPEAPAKSMFVKTGVEGLDALFRDGIPKCSSVLVAGGAGSGKTLLTLQILYNAAKSGKKCFYMSFEESEERLWDHMEKFGWSLGENKKNLAIKRFNLFDITRYIDALLAKQSGDLLIDVSPVMFPEGFKPEIIVVDSLTAIASAFYGKGETYRLYIEQLFRFFEEQNVTTFLISETNQDPKVYSPTGVEEFLADGVIVLYSIRRGNVRENGIEVLKMRGTKHEKKIVAMQIIDNKGVEIYPEQEVFSVDQ
jgi:circadian clock protein KaiC